MPSGNWYDGAMIRFPFFHTSHAMAYERLAWLLAATSLAVAGLDSCRHHRHGEKVIAEHVQAGSPIEVYDCDQAAVRLWLGGKLSFKERSGVPLNKKEAKAVRRCIQAIRTGKRPWPDSPPDAASGNRYLFVSEGKVIFSIFHGKELVQYPLSQTNPALWEKTRQTLSRKLREASVVAPGLDEKKKGK